VTIGVFDPVASKDHDGENPGSDVARWLSHHGCHVNLQQYPSGGQEIGDCIQKRSAETGADLVVMGAYGHSRMRQTVFGGTTRSVIDQTDFAALLAH
jgi:nucleotide-binding universal stress UspA family protein